MHPSLCPVAGGHTPRLELLGGGLCCPVVLLEGPAQLSLSMESAALLTYHIAHQSPVIAHVDCPSFFIIKVLELTSYAKKLYLTASLASTAGLQSAPF